jgi:hypothetical protein
MSLPLTNESSSSPVRSGKALPNTLALLSMMLARPTSGGMPMSTCSLVAFSA